MSSSRHSSVLAFDRPPSARGAEPAWPVGHNRFSSEAQDDQESRETISEPAASSSNRGDQTATYDVPVATDHGRRGRIVMRPAGEGIDTHGCTGECSGHGHGRRTCLQFPIPCDRSVVRPLEINKGPRRGPGLGSRLNLLLMSWCSIGATDHWRADML